MATTRIEAKIKNLKVIMEYVASRLSEGNKLFPAKITITPQGVTLKVPGFLSGKEQSIPFHLISSVDLETPFIGFSTIKIYSVGWDVIVATGFTKDDVIAIKEQIMSGQKNLNNPTPTPVSNYSSESQNSQSNNSNANSEISKWDKELRNLQELLDDDVLTEDEFKAQKSNILINISQDSSSMTEALRMLKDLEDDDIITEAEFNQVKQSLMKPKTSQNAPVSPKVENVVPPTIITEAPKPVPNPTPATAASQPVNSDGMNNEQLVKLIEMALMDGELTEKEKQILFKKAESLGIDLDEFEMVLDAKLYEKQQSMKQAAATAAASAAASAPVSAAPKSDKYGDVKKCPACGAMVQSFQTKCSDCGHEFTNLDANVSIQKLFAMLNACENERKDSNSIGAAFGGLMSQAFGDKVTEKKKSIISGFPIPNTKADILEFLSTAIPNAKQKGNFITKSQPENKSHNDLAPTWYSKCEQIVMKARFSMKDDKKTLEEINSYANELGIK